MNKFFSNKKLFLYPGIVFAVFMFFSAADASADYYNWGVLKSTNVLSGATVTAINGFDVTADIPATATTSVQFSQDWVNFYSSDGTLWGWDACSDGTTNINLSGLGWSGGLLFYKLKLETTDAAATPSVTDIQVDYDGTEVPPDSGIRYPNEGTLVSTDLLAGLGGNLNGSEKFGYNITSLSAGTAVYAQFSQDGVNWYSSTSTQWAWDTLSAGDHLADGAALDLSGLHWSGDSFYYKLKLTSIDLEQTAVVSEVNLLRKATQINSPQTNLLTDSLVGYWSFNGPDMDWSQTTAEARDLSGNANHGDVIGAAPVAGISGQALEFDGTDDYVNVPNNASIQFNGQAFSASAWVKVSSLSASLKNIFSKDDLNYGAQFPWRLYAYLDDVIFLVRDAGGTNRTVTANNILNTSDYVYAVATFNPTGYMRIYINGVETATPLDVSGFTFSNSSGTKPLRIGTLSYTLIQFFYGIIDEARIYNRALSEDEIGQLYRAGARKMKIDPTKGYKTIIGN